VPENRKTVRFGKTVSIADSAWEKDWPRNGQDCFWWLSVPGGILAELENSKYHGQCPEGRLAEKRTGLLLSVVGTGRDTCGTGIGG